MPPLDPAILARHRRRNRLQSVLMLVGICGWMALVGWLIAAAEGVAWAVLGTGLALLLQPVRRASLLRALGGAASLTMETAPGLCGVVAALAERAGLERVPDLLYLPRGDLVALSAGRRNDAAVVLSAGMIAALSGREIAAVLAHEISHLRHDDLFILRLADASGRLTRLLSLFGLVSVAFYLPAADMLGLQPPLSALLLLAAAPLASDLLTLRLARTREFAADAGAAELTGDPRALMMALRRIELLQGGGWERLLRTPGWFRLIRTHPSTAERLERLEELAPPSPPHWPTLPEVLTMSPLTIPVAGRRRRWWPPT